MAAADACESKTHLGKRGELVKCVVVGDTAVGKTRLICARACNKKVSLSQLLNTHVPTVWAIDQYRIYKEVLERSWEVVDGVNVSLRLWDTFGDHEKDRRFAYGRSDVVLLCFSIGNPKSLRNCKAMWLPEIRRFCPNTPVLLVGCKNDLRFMYCDETYLSYFKDRNPFMRRPTKECDLVMPDQARSIASELGLPYYETSVLTYYGVNSVFENAIRAALVSRRQQRFWLAGFKRVQRPLLQAPFCPPKPCYPDMYVSASTYFENFQTLYTRQAYTDVIFITGSVGFSAHRFYIAAAAPSLARLIATATANSDINCSDIGTRSSSDCSMVSSVGDTSASGGSSYHSEETECLLDVDRTHYLRLSNRIKEKLKRRCSFQLSSTTSAYSNDLRCPQFSREIYHPAVQSISVEQCQGMDHRGRPCVSTQTVVTLTKIVTPNAMRQCLCFIYTGQIDTRLCSLQSLPMTLLLEIRQAAEFLDLPELLAFIHNIHIHEEFLNNDIIRSRLLELGLNQGLYADVHFLLDDGSCPAHRPLLMARCDVMDAMFAGDFRESSAKVVQMPGVSETTFRQLLHYIYTDRIPPLQTIACVPLVELANRLCLSRLVQLIESYMVTEMQRIIDAGGEVTMECLMLLEPCQIHNADQLAEWCMTYLSTNYNMTCRKAPKILKTLHSENQAHLAHHRWPPVWYLKERDFYDKYVAERKKEEGLSKPLKRSRNNSGCLCFVGKTRRGDDSSYHSV
ncbi:rho-related BTB domain-containing protein 1-like isoform X3 [Daphnia pulex]|uniref:rho-related BTB domain-containing protein 1-like isoform X3 n=1 Tax=Daphnia pulex TaxID=6669 RepID=UPI001EDD81DC|nr:rho-related BTB domain-containing protein 1-like isoform X3 [Daphnia pulex]